MTEAQTPAQKFQMALERVEKERKRMRKMASTMRMRTESSDHIMQEIMGIVCDVFGVSKEDVVGRTRHREVVVARHTYCFLCSKLDPMGTLKRVGMSIDRDHSTVLHAIKKVNDMRLTDYRYMAIFKMCLMQVANSNKDFMERIQFEPDQLDQVDPHKTDLIKALNAQRVVQEFILAWDEYELKKEYEGDQENKEKSLIDRLRTVKDLAIEKGF